MKWHESMEGIYSLKIHLKKHGVDVFLVVMVFALLLVFSWAIFCAFKELCPINDFINHYYR